MYSHAPLNYTCPFCTFLQAASGAQTFSVETDRVFQNEFTTAFIGMHQCPRNPGNTIVIPNQHYENIYDLPGELAGPIHGLAKAVALAMKESLQCDGVSLRQHNEPAGNQDVWHYHLHVTPRYTGDHFYDTYRTASLVMPVEERAKLAEKLRPGVAAYMKDMA